MSFEPESLAVLDPVTRQHVEKAADALQAEFADLRPRTIARYIVDSLDLLGTSRFSDFVPVLAYRFARERLRRLGRPTAFVTKVQPEVLFVCVHNAGRSQMAAGLVTLRSEGRIHVRSAGSAPGESINPLVVEAMAELGIDLAEAFPKPLTDEVVRAADVVITMGCGDACPIYPGKRYEDWELDDPAAAESLESVRAIRDASTLAFSSSWRSSRLRLPDAELSHRSRSECRYGVQLPAGVSGRQSPELEPCRCEDVSPERVLRRELGGAVQLEDDPPAPRVRQQVDPDEIAAHRASRGEGELLRLERRRRRQAVRPECDVRAPLTVRSDADHSTHHPVGRDDEAQVVPARGHELLHERTLPLEPRPVAQRTQMCLERRLTFAAVDVGSPASEPRLHDDAAGKALRPFAARDDEARPGMREPCAHEEPRGEQLVVGGEKGARPVEDPDAAGVELAEGPEPVVDPVQASAGRPGGRSRRRPVPASTAPRRA